MLKKNILEKVKIFKEKFNKSFDIILPIYIAINIIYINIGSYFVIKNRLFTLQFSRIYIYFLFINILLIKYLVLSKKYKKNKIDILLKLITIFALIATVFAYDVKSSLFGYIGRGEGLIAILYYITMLFLISFVKKEYKKNLIYLILLGGFIQVIYAICQKFNFFGVIMLLHHGLLSVYGFTTNPNFFGTLMVLCLSYSMGLFVDSKNIDTIILYAVLSCFFFAGLLLTNTVSAVVGLIAVLLFLLFYSIKTKKIRKFLLLCILLGYVLSTMHFCGLTKVVKDVSTTTNETTRIAKGDIKSNYGNGRIYVWKETIKVVPKYMIHGIGIDNFAYIIDGKPLVNNNAFYDKAHNEYLQILVTMGIFSLISYLCLHFIIIKNGIKNSFITHEIYYILPVIGYLVQAQFNLSVVEVAPFFYMALGILVDRK